MQSSATPNHALQRRPCPNLVRPQLASAHLSTGREAAYGYDTRGNRNAQGAEAAQANNGLDQATGRTLASRGFGLLGSVDKDAKLFVSTPPLATGWQAMTVDPVTGGFYGWWNVPAGYNGGAAARIAPRVRGVLPSTVPGGHPAIVEADIELVVPPMAESLTYDAGGRLGADAFWTYEWDGPGRLKTMTRKAGTFAKANVQSEVVTFGYDTDGRRTGKTHTTNYAGNVVKVEQSTVLWAGWLPVLEQRTKDGVNLGRRWFQWGADVSGTLDGAGGIGGLVAIIEENAAGAVTRTLLPVSDGLGNVTAVLNAANGQTVARYDFGPFGEPLGESGEADACPFRWQTKWYDAESQHYYFGYQHYDPRLGRWLSHDPLGEAGGFNLYAYAGNDPVNRHDPLGLADSPYGAFLQAQRRYFQLYEQDAPATELEAAQRAMTVLPGDPRVSPTSSAQRILGTLAGSLIGPAEADRKLSPAAPLGSGFRHDASLYGWSLYNSMVGFVSMANDPSRLLTGQQSISAQAVSEEYLRRFSYGERSAADFNLFVGSLAAPWAAGKVGQLAEGTFGALRGFSLAGDGLAGQGMLRSSLFASEAGAIDIFSSAAPRNAGKLAGLENAIRRTFTSGEAERIVLQNDLTVTRVFDKIPGVTGGSSSIGGGFYTTSPIAYSLEAQEILSLGGFNQARFIEFAIIPKGTVIFRGTAAPLGNLPGGGVQIYVPAISEVQYWGIRLLR